ncbi:helix-hairpin-helix domain-containing protein [Cytobacillus gottheilii]|uniref:helix-hairpin-helix domain-containing protein n=1 Tax=Cytobacillus gottheilii TaxID=859144 RepID=UPI0008331FFD|nr:helix-hairpin-helix domain-containing protein [Cytobacillus gottheilii]
MLHFIKEKKLYFMLICLGAGLLILFFFFPGQEGDDLTQINEEAVQQQEALPVTKEVTEEPAEEEIILVDVKGSVENPGVYEAEDGDRVLDLIADAGGLEKGADEKKINFAQRVTDEMVLYIPKEGEETAEIELNMPANSTDDETVNLNTADSAELQTLPGIGPAKAEAIIDYRDTNGPFKEKEELKEISGIGDKTYEKLAELIKVN